MTILFCGDIMPGGVLPYQSQFVSQHVIDLLQSVDFRVGTLECALGDNIPFDHRKMNMERGKNIVYAREQDLVRLKTLNINLVTLANNHVFDLGAEGLTNTIRLLEENSILYCGAGNNLEEASKPRIVSIDNKSFAFIGCCFKGLPPTTVEAASQEDPGIFQTDSQGICGLIKKIRHSVDFVVILPHWGVEYSYLPPQECYVLARQMIDAGADAIIGSHTHIINPRMTYVGKPTYFSLGNFLFPDFCLQVPRPIDYPSSRYEVYSLPIVYNYPKSITQPVRVVWKRSSRIGVVPILKFSDRGRVSHYRVFTILDLRNKLQLLRGWSVVSESLKMDFYGSGIGSLLYRGIKKVIRSKFFTFAKSK